MVSVRCGVVRLRRVSQPMAANGLVWAKNYEGQGDHVYLQMTCTWIQITNYEGQGDHVYLQMTHICIQMSSIWKRATLKSVIYHTDLRATPRLDHMEKGLEPMWRFSSFFTCI